VYCSSHSEAPGTAADRVADISDFYMFQAYESGVTDKTILAMSVYPVQAPYGGPNYYTLSDDHFYEIYIDNNGDATEDITFQFFTGNRLGGVLADEVLMADEDDCVFATSNANYYNKRGFGNTPPKTRRHQGITLNIDGHDIPVALKFLGPVAAGDNSNLNWFEWFRLNVVYGDRSFGDRRPCTAVSTGNDTFIKPFDYAGTKTFGDAAAYEAYAMQYVHEISIPGCGGAARVFVGQRREGFAVSLGAIFDLVNFVPVDGFVDNVDSHNDLFNVNVDMFIMEVPTSCLLDSDVIIGGWSATRRLHHQGSDHVPGRQIARLGNPLVNEVLVGLKDKGKFNRGEPRNDEDFLFDYIRYPTFPQIVNILFLGAVNSVLGTSHPTIAPTLFPRADLEQIFLSGVTDLNRPNNVRLAEMMRLNTEIPATPPATQSALGVLGGDAAGYPNGRRPGDDVIDITLRAAMGVLLPDQFADPVVRNLPFSDGSPTDVTYFDTSFPYFRTPLPGSTGLV